MAIQLPPDDDTLYERREAAALLGFKHPRTLDRHRALGTAPPHIKIGRTIYFRSAALRRHLLGMEGAA